MRLVLVVGSALLATVAAGATSGQAAATSCGPVVGQPQLAPAYRVEMESARRSVVYGDSLVLVLRYAVDGGGYAVDGGGCALDVVLPEFRALRPGESLFQPVRLRAAPVTSAPIGFVPAMWWATPTVSTTYRAVWRGAFSNDLTVGVRPALALRRSGRTVVVAVRAERSYAGRLVRVEARRAARWQLATRLRVGPDGTAAFRLPRASAVRVRVPPIPGYLPATRTLRLRA